MKQIQTINLSAMQNEEAFGFFTLVREDLANLPGGPEGGAGPLEAAKEAYAAKLDAYDEALEAASALESVKSVEEADAAADEAWRASHAYVKAMARHPDAGTASAAEAYVALFERYGNPTKLAQVKELGVLRNLVADLDAMDGDERIGFAAWREHLSAATAALLEAMTRRTGEQGRVQAGAVRETRRAAEAAYRRLVERVNVAAAYEGDTAYATFIDHTNALVDRQKAILKGRSTRSRKKGQ